VNISQPKLRSKKFDDNDDDDDDDDNNNNNNNNNNFINCNWVVTRCRWLFYMHTKYEIGY
jgi:hypothetical protein